MRNTELKNLVEQVYQIYNEITAIDKAFDAMKACNSRHLYYYAQFYYDKLNELIGELKEIIAKHSELSLAEDQKDYIRNVKAKLWCSCSEEFQYEVGKHYQDYHSMY